MESLLRNFYCMEKKKSKQSLIKLMILFVITLLLHCLSTKIKIYFPFLEYLASIISQQMELETFRNHSQINSNKCK